jgi:hypothetical protein
VPEPGVPGSGGGVGPGSVVPGFVVPGSDVPGSGDVGAGSEGSVDAGMVEEVVDVELAVVLGVIFGLVVVVTVGAGGEVCVSGGVVARGDTAAELSVDCSVVAAVASFDPVL